MKWSFRIGRDDYYYDDDADVDENDENGGEGEDYEDEVIDEHGAQMKPAELRAQPPYFVEPEVEIYTQPAQNLLIDCAVQNIQGKYARGLTPLRNF